MINPDTNVCTRCYSPLQQGVIKSAWVFVIWSKPLGLKLAWVEQLTREQMWRLANG